MADERAVAPRRRRRSFGERVRAAREKADPRGETIRRIARALGVEPSELLD